VTHKITATCLLTMTLFSSQHAITIDDSSHLSDESSAKQELVDGRGIKPRIQAITRHIPQINNKWLIGGLAFCTLLSCVHSWSELAVECPYGEHEPSYALEEARAAATNVFNELNMTNCCAAYYNTVRGALQYIVQCAVPESECIAPGSELGL